MGRRFVFQQVWVSGHGSKSYFKLFLNLNTAYINCGILITTCPTVHRNCLRVLSPLFLRAESPQYRWTCDREYSSTTSMKKRFIHAWICWPPSNKPFASCVPNKVTEIFNCVRNLSNIIFSTAYGFSCFRGKNVFFTGL